MEEEPTRGGTCIDRVGETLELDTLLLELTDQIDQVLDASPKPVQLPDHERVSFAKTFLRLRKARAFCSAAAYLVFKDLLTAGLLKRPNLELKILILCGNPCVADQHALVFGLAFDRELLDECFLLSSRSWHDEVRMAFEN